jgi:transposase-like protein
VARELGVSGTTLAFWVKAYRQKLARRPLQDMSDQERIRVLERRNRELEMENALLKRQPCNYVLNGSWQIV